jgi:hypothetical protein
MGTEILRQNGKTMTTLHENLAPRLANGQDAHRDLLIAVQRALAANWDDDQPRIAVIERDGLATVYVSTIRGLGPSTRSDIHGAVRAALAPYTALAPFTNVVFLRRLVP